MCLSSLVNHLLQACSMLEEEELEAAITKCKMLEILNIHACPKVRKFSSFESASEMQVDD